MGNSLNNTPNSVNSSDLVNQVKHAQVKGDNKELMEASKQFESIFINQLLSQMRSTVPKDELLDGGLGEDVFKGMLDEEYSKKMADAGGIGLAQILYEQLSQNLKNK